MVKPPIRWLIAILCALIVAAGLPFNAVSAAPGTVNRSPSAQLARLLTKAHWRTLQTQFFCYQRSPMLTHGFASGGRLWLARHRMRYQIDWPVPSVYVLRHGAVYAKVVGKPWHQIRASQSLQIRPLLVYLDRLGQTKQSHVRIGTVTLLGNPMPKPPQRDRRFVPRSKAKIVGFGITPTSKRLKHVVTRIQLFVNIRNGFLSGLKIFSRQGSTEYWFFAVRKNAKCPAKCFRPAGGA